MADIKTNVALYNTRYGYIEADIRGQRSSFLTVADYQALTQVPNLEEFFVALGSMSPSLSNVCKRLGENHSVTNLSIVLDEEIARNVHALRADTEGELQHFIDLICHQYCIDNVILVLLTAISHGNNANANTTAPAPANPNNGSLDSVLSGSLHGTSTNNLRFHPLGLFPGLEALSSCASLSEVYGAILEESPIACYFAKAEAEAHLASLIDKENVLTRIGLGVGGSATSTVTPGKVSKSSNANLMTMNVELLRTELYKHHFETIYDTAQKIGGQTWEAMKTMLKFDADRRTLSIAMNLLDVKTISPELKMSLFPKCGDFYPHIQEVFATAHDYETIKEAATDVHIFKEIFDNVSQNAEMTIEDAIVLKEIELLKDSLTMNFSFGTIYAWLKLREFEKKNIVWIAECLLQERRDSARAINEIY